MTNLPQGDVSPLKLLIAAAYANWSSNLVGGSPKSMERFNWMKAPRVGDLVMETSSLWVERYDEHRIGWLLSSEMEPFGDDEWWEDNEEGYADEGRPNERVYTIKRLIGGEPFKWRNASFIRVPENLKDFP